MKAEQITKFFAVLALVVFAASCTNPSGSTGIGTGGSTTATPVISPDIVEITSSDEIVITSKSGATVYYTTDGFDPTTDSSTYTTPFTLPADSALQTVKAIAVLDGLADSTVALADYLVSQKVAAVTYADADGAIPDNRDITLSTTTAGATVYFTVDGSDPTVESTEYTGAFTMASLGVESMTVKAFGVLDGYADSDYSEVSYTKAVAAEPVADRLDGSTISSTMTVTLASETTGAAIYYTIDGSNPDATSRLYAAPFTLVAGARQVKAVAILDGYADSSVITVNLTVEAQAEVPVADTVSGFLAAGSQVVLTTSSGLETIFYTVDGSDPIDDGVEYTGSIAISEQIELRAVAAGPGYYPSTEAVYAYRVYESIDTLAADSSVLMAADASGIPVLRAGGSWYDLVSGSLTARTVAAEPAGDVLDFTLDAGGAIHAAYLAGTDMVYWSSVSGSIATVSSADVALADAAVEVDGSGNIHIAFAQDLDGSADEIAVVSFDAVGRISDSSSYGINRRATGIDAVVDSTGAVIVAVSEATSNGRSEETLIVTRNSSTDTWTPDALAAWRNHSSLPALSITADDSVTMAYADPRSNKLDFGIYDVATGTVRATADFETAVSGDTRIAMDGNGHFWGSLGGSAFFFDGTDLTELPFGTGPFDVSAGTAGTYVVDAAGLTLYEMK